MFHDDRRDQSKYNEEIEKNDNQMEERRRLWRQTPQVDKEISFHHTVSNSSFGRAKRVTKLTRTILEIWLIEFGLTSLLLSLLLSLLPYCNHLLVLIGNFDHFSVESLPPDGQCLIESGV